MTKGKRAMSSILAILALALTIAGISFPGIAQAATGGTVWEASSNTGWTDKNPGTISGASATAAMTVNGVRYIYTIINGEVWEAASSNGWKNMPTLTIHGATAIAVTSMNGVRYIYTLINGSVWEATSRDGWTNRPTLTINGASAISVMNMNGVIYIYTIINGQVWEADSNHGWKNYPTGTVVGVSAVSVLGINGVRYIYTLKNGSVWEATSRDGWTMRPTLTINNASAISTMYMNNVIYIYSLINGEAWEADSSHGWANYRTASVFNATAIAATNVNGVKYIYTLKGNKGDIIVAKIKTLAWPDRTHGTIAKPDYLNAKNAVGLSSAPQASCDVFVATVMRSTGLDPNYQGTYTPSQLSYVKNHKSNYLAIPNNQSTSNLQPGDIFISSHHTLFYIGNGQGASASNSDRTASYGETIQYKDSYGELYQIFRYVG